MYRFQAEGARIWCAEFVDAISGANNFSIRTCSKGYCDAVETLDKAFTGGAAATQFKLYSETLEEMQNIAKKIGNDFTNSMENIINNVVKGELSIGAKEEDMQAMRSIFGSVDFSFMAHEPTISIEQIDTKGVVEFHPAELENICSSIENTTRKLRDTNDIICGSGVNGDAGIIGKLNNVDSGPYVSGSADEFAGALRRTISNFIEETAKAFENLVTTLRNNGNVLLEPFRFSAASAKNWSAEFIGMVSGDEKLSINACSKAYCDAVATLNDVFTGSAASTQFKEYSMTLAALQSSANKLAQSFNESMNSIVETVKKREEILGADSSDSQEISRIFGDINFSAMSHEPTVTETQIKTEGESLLIPGGLEKITGEIKAVTANLKAVKDNIVAVIGKLNTTPYSDGIAFISSAADELQTVLTNVITEFVNNNVQSFDTLIENFGNAAATLKTL